MKNLKILGSHNSIATRKYSINGKTFELLYFDNFKLTLNPIKGKLTITPYFNDKIPMGEVASVELDSDEVANFIIICLNHSELNYFESLLKNTEIDYFNVFSPILFDLEEVGFDTVIPLDKLELIIAINEELDNNIVIDLGFVLNQLEKAIQSNATNSI